MKCSYCNKPRHFDSACFHKKNFVRKNKINLSSERSHLNRSEIHKRLRRLRRYVPTATNLIIQDKILQ